MRRTRTRTDEEVDQQDEPVGPVVALLRQQLIGAAKQGIIERVGALLDQGVPVDSVDEQ